MVIAMMIIIRGMKTENKIVCLRERESERWVKMEEKSRIKYNKKRNGYNIIYNKKSQNINDLSNESTVRNCVQLCALYQ